MFLLSVSSSMSNFLLFPVCALMVAIVGVAVAILLEDSSQDYLNDLEGFALFKALFTSCCTKALRPLAC